MTEIRNKAVVPFSLEDLGLESTNFLEKIRSSFFSLPADYYDVRLAKVQFLKCNLPDHASEIDSLFLDYYTGKTSDHILRSFLKLLSAENIKKFKDISPFRKRGIAQFHLKIKKNCQWDIRRIPIVSFSQKTNNYLKCPRKFKELDSDITGQQNYQNFLCQIANMVQSKRDFKSMILTVHHMHSFVDAKSPMASNSPEGIHQDGADHIVSAFVVDRYNISGGISIVYQEDKKTVIIETCLESGQGLCHPDQGSPFWHEVTPIHLKNANIPIGYRSIIGLDMYLI